MINNNMMRRMLLMRMTSLSKSSHCYSTHGQQQRSNISKIIRLHSWPCCMPSQFSIISSLIDPSNLGIRNFSSSSSDIDKTVKDTRVEKDKDEDIESTTIPSSIYVSHLKNPIVHQLWTARQEAKEQQSINTTKSNNNNDNNHNDNDGKIIKTPKQSQASISYSFTTDELLKETYRNPFGQIRFGKLLEDLDALAGNIAFAHVQDPSLSLVTASVDRIQVRSRPSIESDQHLTGKVTYVGTSSMEIRIQCHSSNNDDNNDDDKDNDKEWMEAYFTFVATDPKTKKTVQIPPIHPETDIEQYHFNAGKRRAEQKKVIRKQKKETNMLNPKIETLANNLLQESRPFLLNMPSLADPNTILVNTTKLSNSEICQPQVRNLSNRIFGGFLMRRAYEIAYTTCYVFGGTKPTFIELDDISFHVPVEVGDLCMFNSRVIYTEMINDGTNDILHDIITGTNIPLVTIQVEAWITEPEIPSSKLSNQFYFTFALPSRHTPIRRVLPATIDEARNMATRIIADQEQRLEDSTITNSSSRG